MWIANSISRTDVTLDFGSSGQGLHRDSTIIADGQEIVNAVRLVDFDTNPVQVVVCAECGITGCASGGWVALRRLDDNVLWLPDFDGMTHGQADLLELRPPAFVINRGALAIRGAALSSLRAAVISFPDIQALPRLSGAEVSRILQWDAPGRVLGAFPAAPKLDLASLIASEGGDLATLAADLQRLLALAAGSQRAVALVPIANCVTLFLDLPGTPAWSPLARTANGELVLHIGSGLAIATPPVGP